MSRSSADERINRLRNLTETLDKDNNRQDKAGMMKILSQEFAEHIERKEVHKEQGFGRGRNHRLMARIYTRNTCDI